MIPYNKTGLSLEELISLMAMELRNCNELVPDDIRNTLKFERVLSAAQAAKVIMKKLNPDELKLLEATVNHATQGIWCLFGYFVSNLNIMVEQLKVCKDKV